MASGPVQVSAHAGSPVRGSRPAIEAYRDAVAAKADYIELDIRVTADAELVAFHDRATSQGHLLSTVRYARLCDLVGYEVPKVADVLAVIKGRAKGHLDLKVTGDEHRLVRLALDVLGPGQFIITSREDASVAAIRSRFRDVEEVPVALSLGLGLKGGSRLRWTRTLVSEMWPASRLQASGADWAAVDHRLALAGVAGRCRRQHRKVMVWTVNNEHEIRYWLRREIDVLVTDRTALAVAMRESPDERG
jgi:glycerophosphoryl diester phosphodiesterase